MKAFIKNIASVFLAFLVLFSTMSFSISEHYCGDTLVDRSIFKVAKTCGMKMQKTTSTSDCSITKKNCCENVVKQIEGQDELKISFDKLMLDQQIFIASFVYTYINLFEGLDKKAIPFNDYLPPLIVKDIQVLDEVYII
ncbi:hypothetical protein JYU05_01780 [bacterium AH-315-P13]|nr:hypothetical protein [bacterium AH-315-P13]